MSQKLRLWCFINPKFASPTGSGTHNGTPIPRKSEFRYLGVVFHETYGISCAIQPLATAARRALWAMLSRFKLAGMTNIQLKLRMYKALVLPIMEYCNEVWGPDMLWKCSSIDKLWDNELQRVQTCFFRQLGHLRRTVKTTVLHKEFCLAPVAQGWLRASLALWATKELGLLLQTVYWA